MTEGELAILDDLNRQNVLNMTPLQAMQYISDLQEKLRNEKR